MRFLLPILLSLFLANSTYAQTATEPVQSDGQIDVGENAVADGEIRSRIETLLRQIEGLSDVSVSVNGGVVVLEGKVLDNTKRDQLAQIVNRVQGVVALENRTAISTNLEERLEPAVERIIDRTRNLLANAPIFLVALAVFSIIAVLGWTLTTRLGIWRRLAPNPFIADVYRAFARILFVLLGIVAALEILNATALLGAVLGAAGVVGLALGFAVRDTVENFIASILLSLRQPFRPNDFVEIDGVEGNVARLTSRATILISPDGNHIRIPNATVFKGRITNFTRDANRRFTFNLGVDADSDLAAALATAVQALDALPFVLQDPPVSAWVAEVGDSNVLLTFAAWVDQRQTDFPKARGEAIRNAKMALEAAGFGLPEPIYRVRLDARDTALAQGAFRGAGTDAGPGASTPRRGSSESPLPDASNPAQSTTDVEDAVSRERDATDTGSDLLSEGKVVE